MAKKGNRVQVILECTEHKATGQPELLVILQQKIKRTHRIEWRLKNLILFLNV